MTNSVSYRRILGRMGYYDYQYGLVFHHLNEKESWNSHLKNCRDFILKAIDFHVPSTVTVLGSGWLLDLPLREMADRVSRINLVDIVHPPEVRSQVSELKNVILKEEDISGGLIEEVWSVTRHRSFLNRLRNLDAITVPVYQPDYETGMIISLNILTQLESLPVKLLEKKSLAGDENFLTFRKAIQNNHILFMKEHNSVLITDITEVITERSGNIYEKQTLLTRLPEAVFREEWTWDFESGTSDYYKQKSLFKVLAILL